MRTLWLLPLLLAALPASAAPAPDCDASELVLSARKRYKVVEAVAWRQEDAKEHLCAPFHVTAYYQKGALTKLIGESEGDNVFRSEYYFDAGKLFFVLDKRFSRASEDGPVVETRSYVSPDCVVEKRREKKPRGVGNAVEDFDLSDLRDVEKVKPGSAARPLEKAYSDLLKKLGEACAPENMP